MNYLKNCDEVSRYLFSRSDFSRPKLKDGSTILRIKPSAVAPMDNGKGEWETSVMLTSGCCNLEVEGIGLDHVAKLRRQELVAFVKFLCVVATEVDLKIDHDKHGHDRHCAIKGWPAVKEEWLEKAADLAKAITNHSSKYFKEL